MAADTAAEIAADTADTSREHTQARTVPCERSGPDATDGGAKEDPRLQNSVGKAGARSGAVLRQTLLFRLPKPFHFGREIDCVQRLGAESVAYSAGARMAFE